MKITENFEQVYDELEAIPEAILNKLNDVFLARFNGGVEDLLKELKSDLPLTYNEIKRKFVPKLCVRTIAGIKKINLIFEGEDYSLISDLYNKNFYDLYKIDQEYSFLPKKVRAYYYLITGFQILKQGLPQLNWLDLPVSLVNRRTLEDFESIAEMQAPCIDNKIKGYKVWCISSNDDLIIIDESTSKYFYSSLTNLYALKEILDFADFWDSYCSYVIRNGCSDGFDFSSYCDA